MVIDLLAHVLEFVLGPLFLLFHIPELGAAIGEMSSLIELATTGDVALLAETLLSGEHGLATRTLASLGGTLAWIALVAGAVGGFGELGEVGDVLDLLG